MHEEFEQAEIKRVEDAERRRFDWESITEVNEYVGDGQFKTKITSLSFKRFFFLIISLFL